MSDVGKQIRKKRQEKGITQKQLAKKLGVFPSAVVDWENEKERPTLDWLQDIADALNCDACDLIPKHNPPTTRKGEPMINLILDGYCKHCEYKKLYLEHDTYDTGEYIVHCEHEDACRRIANETDYDDLR